MYAKIPAALTALSMLCGAAPAAAADYVIDTRQNLAFIHFKVSHLGFSYIVGRFNRVSGEYRYETGNPATARAEVSVETASIDSNDAQRDQLLRGESLLDAERFPTIRFQSTGYQPSNRGDRLTGNLTIRDVTRSVVFEVTQIGEGEDAEGAWRSGFYADTVIDASEFGLPDWVGDVEIEVNVEGIRR